MTDRILFIKERRKLLGLNQERFADLIGGTQSSVSRWECGESFPTADILPTIANCLGCDVSDLFREPGLTKSEFQDLAHAETESLLARVARLERAVFGVME